MQATTDLKKHLTTVDYAADKKIIKKFILFFTEDGVLKYQNRLNNLINTTNKLSASNNISTNNKIDNLLTSTTRHFQLDLNDLEIYDDTGLTGRFISNAYSYTWLTGEAIDEILEERDIFSTEDAFLRHRMARFQEKYPDKKLADVFPRLLLRDILVDLRGGGRVRGIREVSAADVGRLVRIRGVVTRVSMAKPCMRVATYVCESCGSEVYQQVFEDALDLLEECASEKCRIRNVKGTLALVSRGSRFVRFQCVDVQELTGDVPQGSIPRTIRVECHGENTGRVRPGESVAIDGIFMPRPRKGWMRGGGLINDVFIYATYIDSCDGGCITTEASSTLEGLVDALILSGSGSSDIESAGFSENMGSDAIRRQHLAQLLASTGHSSVTTLLTNLFAPEIFGLTSVKTTLLLMLVGAPRLTKPDGLTIRGDINVLLLGDPGIAKSQLLKTAVRVSRRGVYATGRGCSGAGLTASVVRDAATGELVLEGGALVLADNGICCIDELDKMNDTDRTAIHEVMEQQSVSISKAGINTTLNARCAVLGAANPVRGRYMPNRSVAQNSGLSASLVSRFDVICVLQDIPDTSLDAALAEHVTALHCGNTDTDICSYAVLRKYIDYARQFNPRLSGEHRGRLLEAYLTARIDPNTTPRYLLTLVRLALAHARLNLRSSVEAEDIDTAIGLLDTMKVNVSIPLTTPHQIYNYIISQAVDGPNGKHIVLSKLFENALFSRDEIENVISDFESTGIWLRNTDEIILFN